MLGAALRIDSTWLEASAFSAKELTPEDSRFYPHPAAPASFAARVRHTFANALEVQVSGERLRNQGGDAPDAYQVSASAYGWGNWAGFRIDGLLDWAVDVDDRDSAGQKNSAHGALFELAVRSPSKREIFWHRSEFNQREEPDDRGGVSSPWFFETLGVERVVAGGQTSGIQLGVFGELTYIHIPESLQSFYGTDSAVTGNMGLHVFPRSRDPKHDRYDGSLTTPPCTEGVSWLVIPPSAGVIEVSDAQLAKLSTAVHGNNSRSVQPPQNRNVVEAK